jgi:hypothetical protein
MKATHCSQATRLEDIPNVGPSIAADLRRIGVERPEQLKGRDPWELYERSCLAAGARQDPCLLDVYISAVRFMKGGPALPWWAFTAERKATRAGME